MLDILLKNIQRCRATTGCKVRRRPQDILPIAFLDIGTFQSEQPTGNTFQTVNYLNSRAKVLTTSVFRFQKLAIDSLKDGLLFLTEGNHAGDLETVLSVS